MPFYTEPHGKHIFYEDIGKGQAIIWIHPPGMGRKVFRQQHVLSSDYRLIFPDLSGNGDSEVVTSSPDIKYYACEIKQLLDHLGISKTVIVGYSCGGAIAQEFAFTYPNRVHAVILSGGFPKADTFGLQFEFLAGMQWVKRSTETLAELLSNSHFRDPSIKQELCDHMAKSDPQVWHEFYDHCFHFDCIQRLPSLNLPLLLMYGERAFWINHHARFYRSCPDVTLSIFDNAYHQLPATHWPIFNQTIVDFLKRKRISS